MKNFTKAFFFIFFFIFLNINLIYASLLEKSSKEKIEKNINIIIDKVEYHYPKEEKQIYIYNALIDKLYNSDLIKDSNYYEQLNYVIDLLNSKIINIRLESGLYLSKDNITEKAIRSISRLYWTRYDVSKLELEYFETPICWYDSEWQILRNDNCWSIWYETEKIKNLINEIQKDNKEIIYYISFQFPWSNEYIDEYGWVVWFEIIITNVGRLIHLDWIYLNIDY